MLNIHAANRLTQLVRAWMAASALAMAMVSQGCGGGGGGSATVAPAQPPSAAAEVTVFDVASRNTGITYPVTVYLPGGALPARPIPVIYALDAETRFGNLMAAMQASGVRAILVGVGNTGTARRQIDFLMPGAVPYYRFLVDELVPLVESRFGADPAMRVLSGHSSSALFVGYAFFMESPANHRFAAFISADGSFWQQPAEVAQAESAMFSANAGHDLALALVLGGDSGGNLSYVQQVYATLLARDYRGLRLAEFRYDLGHVPMDVPFFTDALAYLGLGSR